MNSLHPVIQLVKERKRTNSIPKKRTDLYKLGIVIDGGIMRSVVSSGMCYALEKMGYHQVFDSIYGSSGGAINGSYFKCHQSISSMRGYYRYVDYTVKNKFKRLLKGQRMMSRKDIFNKIILRGKDRLDIDKIWENDIELNIISTSVYCAKSERLNCFDSKKDLIKSLNASFNIPLIMGKPLLYNNNYYFDGGLLESIAYKQAIKDKCTHLLILCTFPITYIPCEISWFERAIIYPYLKRYNPILAKRYMCFLNNYANDIAYLVRKNTCFTQPPYIYTVFQKKNTLPVRRMETDQKKIIYGGKAGFQTIIDILNC